MCMDKHDVHADIDKCTWKMKKQVYLLDARAWMTCTHKWCTCINEVQIIITSLYEVSFANTSFFEKWSWASKSATLRWYAVSFSWNCFSDFEISFCNLQDSAHIMLGNNLHHKIHYGNWTSKNKQYLHNKPQIYQWEGDWEEFKWALLCLRTFPETVKVNHHEYFLSPMHAFAERAVSAGIHFVLAWLCVTLFHPSTVNRLHLVEPDNHIHC